MRTWPRQAHPAAPADATTPIVAAAERDAGAPRSCPPREDATPLPRRGPLGIDWYKAFHVVLTLVGCLILLWALWQVVSPISRILVLFLLAGMLAYVLAAPVNALEPRIGHRSLTVLAVYLLVGAVVVGALALLAQPFVRQATALINDLPRYASELQTRVPEVESALQAFGLQTSVDELKARAAQTVGENGTMLLQHLLGTATELGGLLTDALLMLVVSFYLLLDGPKLRQRWRALVAPAHRDKAVFVEENVARVLGGYLRGQLVMAVTIGLIAGVGCALLGLPYAVVLGVLAGLFELVPMFGPVLSAVPAVLVALFLPFPRVLWVLLFFFAVQQLENNVLGPRITGHAVGLHPVGALFALLVGFQVAGVVGGLFAVPVAGVIWVLATAAYRNVMGEPQPNRRLFPRWRQAGRDSEASPP